MARAQRSGRIEWPTLGLFVGFYVAWLAVVLLHDELPWPVSVAVLALLGGFYMSLQHEALHGHPTSRRSVNTALAFAPLSMWLPYLRYRRTHIVHHGTDLTSPQHDPESFYLRPVDWSSAGRLKRSYILVDPNDGRPVVDRHRPQHRRGISSANLASCAGIGGLLADGPRTWRPPLCLRIGCSSWSVSRYGSTCWAS